MQNKDVISKKNSQSCPSRHSNTSIVINIKAKNYRLALPPA